jgi:hypothetical protein
MENATNPTGVTELAVVPVTLHDGEGNDGDQHYQQQAHILSPPQ